MRTIAIAGMVGLRVALRFAIARGVATGTITIPLSFDTRAVTIAGMIGLGIVGAIAIACAITPRTIAVALSFRMGPAAIAGTFGVARVVAFTGVITIGRRTNVAAAETAPSVAGALWRTGIATLATLRRPRVALLILHHPAKLLHLAGKSAQLALHLLHGVSRHGSTSATAFHGRGEGQTAFTIGRRRSARRSSWVRLTLTLSPGLRQALTLTLALPFELRAHLARHVFEVLGGLVEAGRAKVVDGFAQMTQLFAGLLIAGHAGISVRPTLAASTNVRLTIAGRLVLRTTIAVG